MGTLADSLFNVLMSWVRALVSGFWALVNSEHTTALEFLGKNWLLIAGVIIVCGLVIDWLVWLVRWRPYHLWAIRLRRLLRLPDPEGDEEEAPLRAHAATRRERPVYEPEPQQENADEAWMPLERPSDEEAQRVMQRAEQVPDEALGAYPGMRYGAQAAPREDLGGTQRYAAVHSEGPGSAEVERRRAEIAAWQQQMQEEARAEAERAARELEAQRAARQAAYEAEQQRMAQAAYEAEQQRMAQAAYEAEQQRMAQAAYEAEQQRMAQAAYEAEQQRMAQAEYERQMAEYERQQEQYARDLAEYERKKAEYEAELARRQEAEAQEEAREEAPAVQAEPARSAHRRRGAAPAYSDYVPGEQVDALPDPPQWPQIQREAAPVAAPAASKKPRRDGGLMSRMAKMIEPEEEELTGIASLPPRVDMRDAYRPAKAPQKQGRRKR